MTKLPEIMDTIERERRINKDDLIRAVEVAIGKHDRMLKVEGQPAARNPFLGRWIPQGDGSHLSGVILTTSGIPLQPDAHTHIIAGNDECPAPTDAAHRFNVYGFCACGEMGIAQSSG